MTLRHSRRFYVTAGLLIFIGIVSIVRVFIAIGKADTIWIDFPGQYQLCAYVVKGVDPYPYIGSNNIPEQVREIGSIPATWNAVPWGLLLGNVFYAGFLNIKHAKIFYIVMNVLLFLLLTISISKKARKIYRSKEFECLAVILVFSPDFLLSIGSANAGGMICIMLLLAWIFCDDRPILAGILLGLAMVKPQDALIICFAFLLGKRFMPLVVAAVVDLAAWLCVSLMTSRGMIELLKEFMMKGAGSVNRYSGILTLFFSNRTIALIASMTVGIVFVLLMDYIYSRRTTRDNEHFRLCFSYVASVFWSYAYWCDNYVLLFPAIVCLYIMIKSIRFKDYILWLAACLYCNYGIYVKSGTIWIRIIGHTITNTDRHLINTIYAIGLIIISFFISLHFSRAKTE